MNTIRKSLDALNNYVKQFLNFLLIIMLLLAVFQVLSRYVINYSFSWTEEVSRFIFIWVVMLGSSVLVREKGQVAITLFIDMFKGKVRNYLEIFVTVASMIFLSILLYQGTLITLKLSHQVSPAAEIPMWVVYGSIAVGPLLMLTYYFEILLDMIGNWTKKGGV